MIFRRLFLMLVGLAMALAPLGMAPMAAMAAAPASHHGAMASAGHCDEQGQPQKQERHHRADQGCCMAGCMAASLPAPGAEPLLPAASRQRPAPDRFRLGYLGEIATPPPRA